MCGYTNVIHNITGFQDKEYRTRRDMLATSAQQYRYANAYHSIYRNVAAVHLSELLLRSSCAIKDTCSCVCCAIAATSPVLRALYSSSGVFSAVLLSGVA
jgi:hypothetical protein